MADSKPSTNSSESLIQIKDLSVDFITDDGIVKAVKNISFDIPKGKTVGLVGESGSGKSVTSLAIMRLIANPPGKITSGQIHFKNQDLLAASENDIRKVIHVSSISTFIYVRNLKK